MALAADPGCLRRSRRRLDLRVRPRNHDWTSNTSNSGLSGWRASEAVSMRALEASFMVLSFCRTYPG